MSPVLARLVIVVAVIAVSTAAGWWWRRRDGRVREGNGQFARHHLAAVGLDAVAGNGAALLLGSPTCAPCVTVKRVLAEVADEHESFRWVYADAADHLDIAEAHHVMRVPTLFVIDRRGRILARTSGVPAKRDLLRVLENRGRLEESSAA